MQIQPPAGFDDMLGDAEGTEMSSRYVELEVPGVGYVMARKPMPNAIANLAMAANSKINERIQVDHLMLFVQNHITSECLDKLLFDMITDPNIPENALSLVAEAISCWGTARPTGPSSRSR